MRRTLVALVSVVVIVIGIVGYAAAALPSTQAGKIAKACTNSNHVLSLVNGGRCPTGAHKVKLSTQGGPGMALGYAHIAPNGVFDATRSWGVKSSNAVSTNTGFWCFRGLPFKPQSGAVTPDYNGLLNGQIASVEIRLPAVPGDCGLSSAQFEVFTGLVSPGSFTAGTNFGFYIVFY